MANALFPEWKESLLAGLLSGTVKAMLVDLADYTFSAAHDFLADVPAAARVATSPALTTKSAAGGVFDADDTTFSAVVGDESEALILFVDTGNEATSRLVAYFDTGVTGLPVTPNGGDINVNWDNGAAKIFAL